MVIAVPAGIDDHPGLQSYEPELVGSGREQDGKNVEGGGARSEVELGESLAGELVCGPVGLLAGVGAVAGTLAARAAAGLWLLTYRAETAWLGG